MFAVCERDRIETDLCNTYNEIYTYASDLLAYVPFFLYKCCWTTVISTLVMAIQLNKDVRVLQSVLTLSAANGHLATNENGDRSRRPCSYCLKTYAAFLRLAMPANPSRPEPNSQTAAGTGTADTSKDAYGA